MLAERIKEEKKKKIEERMGRRMGCGSAGFSAGLYKSLEDQVGGLSYIFNSFEGEGEYEIMKSFTLLSHIK